MSWRDQLLPASFRGVPFEVDDRGGVTGRRLVVDEYPERNLPGIQDLGLRTNRLTISAFVLGDDYLARSQALMDACEREGAGELVHPSHGRVWVRCDVSQWSESPGSGGLRRFSLTFVEVAQIEGIVEGLTTATTSGSVSAAGAAATAAATAESTARDAATARLPAGTRRIYTAAKSAQSQSLAAVLGVTSLGADLEAEVYALANTYALAKEVAAWPWPALLGAPDLLTAAWAAWQRRVSLPAVRRAAELSVAETYTTAEDATARSEEVAGLIEAQEASAADHDVLLGLRQLRAATAVILTEVSTTLPRLVTVDVPEPTPAIVLAYDRLEDASRDDEVLARNEEPHPGFIAGSISVPSR